LSAFVLVPVCMLPYVTHRLVAEERAFAHETGLAYLRAAAETWAARLAQGGSLPEGEVGSRLKVIVAEVDGTGKRLGAGVCFPTDGRSFGEAVAKVGRKTRRVRVTWPGEVGRDQAHARRLDRLERTVVGVCHAMILIGFVALICDLVRTRAAARRHVDYAAGISSRLKPPLTSLMACAELVKDGRLDDQRKMESAQMVIAEASKLSAILDEMLARVKVMCRN